MPDLGQRQQTVDQVCDRMCDGMTNDSADFGLTPEECARLADHIVRNGYRRVALQFQDELLATSPLVAEALNRAILGLSPDSPPVLYILADSALNSSCCVDEVAAAHYKADCIVHFGHSCQAVTTQQTPVLFSFPAAPLDINQLCRAVSAKSAVVCRGALGQRDCC